jgi:hypothetical protein
MCFASSRRFEMEYPSHFVEILLISFEGVGLLAQW